MKHWSTWCFAALCALAALSPSFGDSKRTAAPGFPGWPAQFEGRTLNALPLTPLEERFAQQFPGRVGRFSDGRGEVIMRWVSEGNRKLHSASDCFKASGYAITPQPIAVQGTQRWSVFLAEKGAQRLIVRERISDGGSGQWSDVSAWYWAVVMGRSAGPWWAVTQAQAVTP